MTILVTFPGRFGDLLWALPTLRALSRRVGPVTLQIAGEFQGLAQLLRLQPYIQAVLVDPDWVMGSTQEANGPTPAQGYDAVLHLGYQGWPDRPLPFYTLARLNALGWLGNPPIREEDLQLQEPWITLPPEFQGNPALHTTPWICGFTETHFELKYGLWELLNGHTALGKYSWTRPPRAGFLGPMNISTSPRWKKEAGFPGDGWLAGAQWIRHTQVLLADCSAWHVLAVAMGTPTILVEPMEARHNPIFYPLGWHSRQVRMVLGHDGRPTWDARHVAETLEKALTPPTR